jgi:serine protease Do
MERRRYAISVSLAWLIALVVVLAAIGGVAYRYHGLTSNASAATMEPPKELLTLQEGFVSLAEHAKPSVVNISTEQKVEVKPSGEEGQAPPGMDELFKFFRKRFGDQFEFPMPVPPQAEPRRSLGSGVIIDPSGYILTSAHVVRGGDKVTVTVMDGKEMPAKIIGSDSQTDLAIIKIESKEPLVAALLGDADKERVGSWVMAIGSPLGLEETVTVGVISAKNRTFLNPSVEGRPFRGMLQTDAVINPGNSGGPLLNLSGEVIAINTLIVSTTGYSIGLGFAIPIDADNKRIIESLKRGETPMRGQLGVYIRSVNEAIASVFGVEKGAFVDRVMPDSPAEKAGIQPEDIIVQYGDATINDEEELVRAVEQTKPGMQVPVTVVRDGKRKTLEVTIGQVPTEKTAAAPPAAEDKLGIGVSDITDALRQQYKVSPERGVVVTKVDPNGDGARALLQTGDVIVKINRAKTDSVTEYQDAVKQLKTGSAVVMRVWRGEQVFTLTIRSLGE